MRHSDFSHSVKYITTESGFGLLVSNASTAHVPTDSDLAAQDQYLALADFTEKHFNEVDNLILYYVGHGDFTQTHQYFLATKKTTTGREFVTGLEIEKIALTIDLFTRVKRVMVILDCCFAGEATKAFQGAASKLIIRQTICAFPSSGTALLVAASKDDVALSPVGERFTRFSGALLSVLENGSSLFGQRLSLQEVRDLVAEHLRRIDSRSPRPELHVPRQPNGDFDVARLPFFPNLKEPTLLTKLRSQLSNERDKFLKELGWRSESVLVLPARGEGIRKKQHFKIGVAATTILLSAWCLFISFVVFYHNSNLVDEVEQAYLNIGETDYSPAFLEQLAPLRKKIIELESYATKGPPLKMTFGMYQGEKLLYPARNFFVTIVRNHLLKQVLRENKGLIKKYATQYATSIPPASDEFTRIYEALKLHLLLSSPREASEPGFNKDQQRWATEKLFSLLTSNQAIEPFTQTEIRNCIELYTYLVSKNENYGTSRDAKLVADARETLSKAPYEDIVLNSILSAAEGPVYDLNLTLLVEGTSHSIQSDKKISGPFTLRGWREKVFPKLQIFSRQDDQWVLGKAYQEQDISRIRNRYYERYIAEWESFIGSLAMEKNLKYDLHAYNLLKHLTYDDSLHKLWNGIASNVRLANALENEAAQKAQQAATGASFAKGLQSLTSKIPAQGVDMLKQRLLAGPKMVERHFQDFLLFGTERPPLPGKTNDAPVGSGNLPLDRYLEQLQLVRSALENAMADPHERFALTAAMDTARSRIHFLIESQAPKWRPTLMGFLWEPIKDIEKNDFKAVAAIANQSWCEEVLPELEKLKEYYPFSPTGPDSSLTDFSKVFAPETGTIWSFVNSVKIGKQKLIERRGNRYQFAKQNANDATKAFSGKFLTFLDQAWDISASFFSEPSKMEVPFSVLLKPAGETISTIVLEIDGVSISYAMGPEERHSLLWPNPNNFGKGMVRALSKQGKAQDVSRKGEWGFLRLLEDGAIKQINNVFVASWHFNQVGGDVEIELFPKRKEHPFLLQKFRSLEFPQGIDCAEVCPFE